MTSNIENSFDQQLSALNVTETKVDREESPSGVGLRVRLARPKLHNAFNAKMISELSAIFDLAAKNTKLRYLLLQGEGPSFCSGADLEWMKSMVSFSLEENTADSDKLFGMFEKLSQLPFPTLACVQGNVMGGGLGLLAACDIVASENSAKFCFSEVRLGLVPAVISSFVLRKIPYSKALELMLTGKTFEAQEAKAIGLIHFVGNELEAENFIDSQIKLFCDAGPQAVRETKFLLSWIAKQNLNPSAKPLGDSIRERSVSTIARARVSEEGQEGLKSFFEKRTPRWRGKNV